MSSVPRQTWASKYTSSWKSLISALPALHYRSRKDNVHGDGRNTSYCIIVVTGKNLKTWHEDLRQEDTVKYGVLDIT